MRYLPLVLLLAACSPNWRTHEPKLSAPVDRARFTADLQTCKGEVMNPKPGGGFFGLSGMAVDAATDSSFFDPPNTLVDRCMARRGYPVLEEGAQ